MDREPNRASSKARGRDMVNRERREEKTECHIPDRHRLYILRDGWPWMYGARDKENKETNSSDVWPREWRVVVASGCGNGVAGRSLREN